MNDVLLLAPTEGFRLTIHPIQSFSNPLGEGFDVNLEMISNIGIRKVQFEHVHPEEGGNCVDVSNLKQRSGSEVFHLKTNQKYSWEVKKHRAFDFIT